MNDAGDAIGLTGARARKRVTQSEWEKKPLIAERIAYWASRPLPGEREWAKKIMDEVELNARLSEKIRACEPAEMTGRELRAADILSKNKGLQKQKLEHTGPDGVPLEPTRIQFYIPTNGREKADE